MYFRDVTQGSSNDNVIRNQGRNNNFGNILRKYRDYTVLFVLSSITFVNIQHIVSTARATESREQCLR